MKGSAQVQVCDAGELAGLSWLWQFEQLGEPEREDKKLGRQSLGVLFRLGSI